MTVPDAPSSERALATTWVADLIATPDAIDGRATLRPSEKPRLAPGDTLDERELPLIAMSGEASEYELRGTLGRGGMAVVERAWQRSLGREVAIKRASGPRLSAHPAMVREARVVGGLEHPNIVPVHELGRDEDGHPVIVMKRVSGESWQTLLRDAEHRSWGDGDRLARNLDILRQVCRAIELAHDRGWLHRDLKTENVMIGEFGEVYVLDWGIAVPLELAELGEATFAGTPAYMAPEMAANARLTERTDVFLIGGILHEVLTGESLHEAGSLREILDSALTPRARRYGAHVPPELAAIAARATAYHAEDRFATVASLRRALEDFAVHRDALALAERAWARLDDIDAGAAQDPRAERLEARAGFRQSLSLWVRNERAQAGLDRCLLGLVEQELEDENPAAAALWAAERSTPDPSLDVRIAAKAAELAERARELEALRGYARDRDVRVSADSRRRRAKGFAVLLAAVGAASGSALRAGWFELGYLELGGLQTLVATSAAAAALWRYREQNLLSRWLANVMVVAAWTPLPVMLATWRLGLPAETSLAIDALVKAGGAVTLGATVQRVFYAAAAINVTTAAALLAFPATYPLEIAVAGIAIALFVVGGDLVPAALAAPPMDAAGDEHPSGRSRAPR
ncbi:MAG: serine/threonine protein kinase [Sandaracinaceae bacterium]|nr:serine/threonine protein kinase [Sandaracinaceae bacterium]